MQEKQAKTTLKQSNFKCMLLEQLFTEMKSSLSVGQLYDLGFSQDLEQIIRQDSAIQLRLKAAKIFGSIIVPSLIKLKKYRQPITDFIDTLRLGKNFRDRQVYLKIAKASLKSDKEIFKKHFAKCIGTDMCEEKIKVVQISLAKLMFKVPNGYSRSCDKVRESLI